MKKINFLTDAEKAAVLTNFTAPAPTGGNDTAGIQAVIDAAAAAAASYSRGKFARVCFAEGNYLIDGFEFKSNVFFDFGLAYFSKLRDPVDIFGNSMIRTIDGLTSGSYYGKYKNMVVRGGTFDAATFKNPAAIFRLQNVEDVLVEGTTLIHPTPQYPQYALTAAPAGGATSATLTAAYSGTTGTYQVLFANDDLRSVTLTNGSTAVAWAIPLTSASPASFGVVFPPGWGFQIGGRRIRMRNCRVLNGKYLFQDAMHVTTGNKIKVSGGYFEGGDDPIALGIDFTNVAETIDDEPLSEVTINGAVVNAKYGSIKIYYGMNTATGMPMGGERGKIKGVKITGVTGSTGARANGGVYIADTTRLTLASAPANGATSATLASAYTGPTDATTWMTFPNGNTRQVALTNGSTTVTWTGGLTSAAGGTTVLSIDPNRIQDVEVDANLTVGSALSDGENAAAFYALGGKNIKITGTYRIADTPYGSKAAIGRSALVMGGEYSVKIPAAPAGAGLVFTDSKNITVHDSLFVGGAGAGRGLIELNGVQGWKIHDNAFDLVPTGTTCVLVQSVGSGLLFNSGNIHDNTGTKAPGATTTRFYGQQSGGAGFVTFLGLSDNDFRGTSNATAIDGIYNSTGVTPDDAWVSNNRGFGGACSVALQGRHYNVVRTLTLTAAPASGAASATLTTAYSGTTGTVWVQFSNGNYRQASVTNGSTAITWAVPLTSSATATPVEASFPSPVIISGGGTTPVPLTALQSNRIVMVLTGDTTIAAAAGAVVGTEIEYFLLQDTTGNRVITMAPEYTSQISAIAASGTANTTTRLHYKFDGLQWVQQSANSWV